MSVQTRGEFLATDNPENIFIRPDFHTINHAAKTVNQAPVGVTRAAGGGGETRCQTSKIRIREPAVWVRTAEG